MPFHQCAAVRFDPNIRFAAGSCLHPTVEFRNEKIPKLFYKRKVYRVDSGNSKFTGVDVASTRRRGCMTLYDRERD
jgi:hypothetical protein